METDKLTNELEASGLEVVIGLETHIRLNTLTKLFCSCPNEEIEMPNQHICSVCTGQMGVLPAVNKEAIKKAISFGKSVNSSFSNNIICWDRKHYEYPDLPKNFQLTQFQKPIIPDGYVQCFRNDGSHFKVELEQVHIEEDAAKLIHEQKYTLVDFNKAGVPLIEVVTKPCIHNISDASIYAQNLQRIVQVLRISNANLEKGEFKSDVSVSLRKKGTNDLNPRAEIKNLNSFRFMVEAIIEEVVKQLDFYTGNKYFRPEQTTVLFDADLKQTRTMRKKEYAADYRFALEPDIPPVNITNAIDEISIDYRYLPFKIEAILIEGGVRPQDAKFFTTDLKRSEIFLKVNERIQDPLFVAKTLTNNLKPENYIHVTNTQPFAEVFSLFKEEKISSVLFQEAVNSLLNDNSFNYTAFFQENTVSEEKINESIIAIIEQNPLIVKEINAGNIGKVGILVGKVLSVIGKGVSGKDIRDKIENILSNINTDIKPELSEKGVKSKISKDKIKAGDTENRSAGIIIEDCYRTHLISDISDENLSEYVRLAGWVSSIRDHGELVFLDLRDSSYEIFQIRLTRENLPNLDELTKLNPESVVMVEGQIIKRSEDDYNINLRTGTLELDTKILEVLNISRDLPFEIRRASKSNETIRLKYKYLDHRNAETRLAIINRYKVIRLIREILNDYNFIEIETPILTAGTDEGAREYIVPTRKFPGRFYSLPQSPQQYKQLIMIGGFDKYFQIARCFRDEDSRGDRQSEFTQLDIEMSFVNMQNIIDINTNLFNEIVTQIYGNSWKLYPFKILTYKDAMEKYGTDRPDLRFGLQMEDITEIVKGTSFKIFADSINAGGIVKCIKVDSKLTNKRITKGQIEMLTSKAQKNGLGGLAYIIVNENELQSPIIKYLGEDITKKIIQKTNAIVGDVVFFSAADFKTANKALDAVRQELGEILNLIKPKELHPAWIIDFPLFKRTEEGNWTFSHNPFSMPKKEYLINHLEGKNIGEIISQQYDLIMNGIEIGGGSIRAHKAEILEATFRNMGYDRESIMKSVGHMLKAFQYGAPPHGGIAWGIDRLLMILEEKSSIRDVIAFPKTGAGEEILFGSPSLLPVNKILEANINTIGKGI